MKNYKKNFSFIFIRWFILSGCICILLSGCDHKPVMDVVYFNGTVYTIDSAFSIKTAFAVKDGKIYATGSDQQMLELFTRKKIDLERKIVYPGFQDAHGHFYGYGDDLRKIWLLGSTSFDNALQILIENQNKQLGGWIFGRGWDQNDWVVKEYPDNTKLDSLFPSIPVFLLRVDGHAALVNQKALDLAGITPETVVDGGLIESKNGKLTGLLIDNAVDLVYRVIPLATTQQQSDALINAQHDALAVGLTSITDAGIESKGLGTDLIALIDSLQNINLLKIRLNVMASLDDFQIYKLKGKIKTPSLSVHSFKLYADGSLGSRGACLLQPYLDQPDHYGFLISSPYQLDSIAAKVASIGFQLNTHCIGDSAQRLMLQIYEKYTQKIPDHRWRIEHAQVINLADTIYYSRNHILPSMQPTHATSDMYWAEERIGPERIKGAYALRTLMRQNGMIAAGSDFPVESINPLYGFYAAVSRKDQKGFPPNGFMKENALTREEALRAMTIWAAYAAFAEKETGSLEPGKYADFVIMEEDLMKVIEEDLWKLKVDFTFVAGEQVFHREE